MKKCHKSKKETACSLYGSMKQYCLGCRKFCIEIKTDEALYEDRESCKSYECVITGSCFSNANDNTPSFEVETCEFPLLPNFKIKYGHVELSGELLDDLLVYSQFGYVTPVRKSFFFSDDDSVWSDEESERKLKRLLEAKKVFFKKCDKYLRTTRCPLELDDRNCSFFVERAMKKWNKM